MDNIQTFQETKAALVFSQLALSSRKEVWDEFSKGKPLADIFKIWMDESRPELNELLAKFNPEKEVMDCVSKKIELISISDSTYPDLLRTISDPPFILYARGETGLLNDMSMAVVGSRQASFYGMEQARRFARVLADAGLTIVSGLALGIDQAAHESVLGAGGRTIAVLGCGMDVIYPAENRSLYERMAKHGLILSEYPLGAEPRSYHFPRRNRILSGLSLGVLVVEAHERSGSLITAYQALEQGREVYAIPGPVHHITSRGTHRLIREGAALVETPEEIIASIAEHSGVLEFQTKKEIRPKSFESIFPEVESQAALSRPEASDESSALVKILKTQSCDYEGLFELSNMEPHDFARALTELEIEGKVRKNFSGYFELS
jgi:DNA processing protein